MQARQKTIKDTLLQQQPVIGRDRMKARGGSGYQPSHSRTNSGFDGNNNSGSRTNLAEAASSSLASLNPNK